MARMRSVKPEFWTDQELAEQVSRDARLLYIGLWTLADEHARLRGDPRYIKGQLLAYDDDLDADAVGALIDELVAAGKVVRYQCGTTYLHLVKLGKHQRLEPEKVPSRLPEPPDADSSESRANSFAPRADSSALKHVAGSREHVAGTRARARETARPEPAKAAAAAEQAAEIVLDALPDVSADEAAAVVEHVRVKRKPDNLPALVRTIAKAGELPSLLDIVRAAAAKADARRRLAVARDGPACEHGEPGGAALHPVSGKPLCPQCRARSDRDRNP